MDSSSDATYAAVFDFVADYLDDLEQGRPRRLSEYLARYPRHEEAVAAEYVRLRAEESRSAFLRGSVFWTHVHRLRRGYDRAGVPHARTRLIGRRP